MQTKSTVPGAQNLVRETSKDIDLIKLISKHVELLHV